MFNSAVMRFIDRLSAPGVRAILLVSVLFVAAMLGGRPIAALAGPCTDVTTRYFSMICQYTNLQYQGTYAEWPSVPLNISAAAAANGEYIAQVLWIYENFGGVGPLTSLEVGDTAGGGRLGGHLNQWARMWYWVDGSAGSPGIQNFIAYSPSDSVNRSYEIAWDAPNNRWLVCAGGTCQISVTSWKDPNTFRSQIVLQDGMEIANGGRALDASKNSGNFLLSNLQIKGTTGLWGGWNTAGEQVDSFCGIAPTCLQGWWSAPPPPFTNRNIGKPSQ